MDAVSPFKLERLFGKFKHSVNVRKKFKLFGVTIFSFSTGWLWIEDDGDHWNVTLASHKTSHMPTGGPVISVDFRKTSGNVKSSTHNSGVYKSSISMHMVRKKSEIEPILARVIAKVDEAYAFHFPPAQKRSSNTRKWAPDC